MMQLATDLSLSSRRSSVSAAAPWTPFSLGASLLAFWDAEQASTLALSGSSVVTWTDRTATAAAPTQATAGFQPVYSATSFNSRPGVTFDGVDDNLILGSLPGSYPVGTAGSEIWALASQDVAGATTGNQTLLSYGDLANANCRRLFRINSTNVNRAGVTATGSATDPLVDLTGIHVVRGTFAAAAISVAVDGNAATSTATVPATAATGGVAIGALTTGTNRYWKGAINALLITAPLSAPDAASLLAYLKARGGLP